MSASSDIDDVARLIVQSGHDTIPKLPDKRKLKVLRRWGLLIYPDGYSLTAEAMEKSVRSWRLAAKDAEQWGNPDRAVELQELADKGEAWASKHSVTPDVERLQFGDLSFDLYHVLWNIATGWGEQAKEAIVKKYLVPLTRKGYLEDGRIPSMTKPTAKAEALLKEYGNPFLGLRKTAAERVVDRFLDKASSSHTH